jgi:hypothetical protein
VAVTGEVRADVGEAGEVQDPGFLEAFAATRGFREWAAAPDSSPLPTVAVELAEPVAVVGVPPSALYNVVGDAACVVDEVRGAVVVRIVGSQFGQSFVTAEPLPGRVKVWPPEEAPPCA